MKIGLTRHARLLLLIGLLVALTPAAAESGRWPARLQEALAETGVTRDAVGLYVQEVGADHPLFAWNADRSMNPASTMKLVTTLAALELLGPAYVWRTEAYADGTLSGDTLNGNLVLKGYGDPKLTLENFWLLLRELRSRGLKEIRGDLIVDRSLFALTENDPGRFDNEPTRAYNVAPDALLVNYKAVRLQFIPQEDRGTVKIVLTPDLPQISILNQLVLGAGNCDFWPDKPQALPEQARLVFTGVFPRGCGERSKNFSLLTPNEYLLALFQQTWRELGGTITGTVRDGVTPPEAKLLATSESQPLGEVIRDINKFSMNVMARHVFLTLSLDRRSAPRDHREIRARRAGMAQTQPARVPGARAGKRLRLVAQRAHHPAQSRPHLAKGVGEPTDARIPRVAADTRRGRDSAPPSGRIAGVRAGAHQDRLSGGRTSDRRLCSGQPRPLDHRREHHQPLGRAQRAVVPGRCGRVGVFRCRRSTRLLRQALSAVVITGPK